MDPAAWSLKEWVENLSVPTVAIILLALNLRGTLWWKPQVDTLLATTVEGAKRFDEVRVEQINVERSSKLEWKAEFDGLKKVVESITATLHEERRKVAALSIALEEEKRKNEEGKRRKEA